MRFPEQWLREWIDPDLDSAGLARQLTLLGLEVEAMEAVAPPFDGIVIGRVVEAGPHPKADRLRLCTVDDGSGASFQVVCGADNAVAGLRAPFARVGAQLPDGTRIRKARLRGVESQGMLCSEHELGLGDDAGRLMALPGDAPVGADLRAWGRLDDTIFAIDLTPNRGDCLSIRGLAREVAVANGLELRQPEIPPVAGGSDDEFAVRLDEPTACPRYAGRVIRGIDAGAASPDWLRNRLLAAGVRPLHPVVDVTNYVMLELGQPMHAFDLDKLAGGIHVRHASGAEAIELLDGRTLTPTADTLVIADDNGPVAIAGIMGGHATAVGERTGDIFVESACFLPQAMAGRARRLAAHTDSSHRFERGVDPQLAPVALERATRLILDICGGTPGPLVDTVAREHVPVPATIHLRGARIRRLLGYMPEPARIESILRGLGVNIAADGPDWTATAPSWRPDLVIEPDLIEEIVRVEGYNRAPRTHPPQPARMSHYPEQHQSLDRIRDLLVEREYHEAVTYSFVDADVQRWIDPDARALALANPIASDMGVMRTSLWPGLLQALRHNQNRQQGRVRLFETGLRFCPQENGDIRQEPVVAVLAAGPRTPEHWASDGRGVDFFDLKGDFEAMLGSAGGQRFAFTAASHPALHPGQSARITEGGRAIGWIGSLHPRICTALDLSGGPVVGEILLEPLLSVPLPKFEKVSRYPSIRRDLAVIVDENIPVQTILDALRTDAPEVLSEAFVFDVYRGPGIDSSRKSVALGLILQGFSRTLTEQDVEAATARILAHLQSSTGATLRE